MWSRHLARLSYAAVAGLALVSAGFTGASGAVAEGAAPARAIPAGTISTVAGGVGGPGLARSIAMGRPCGLRTAGASLYIGTGAEMRRVNVLTDALTTVAGNNEAGPLGDGGVATATAFSPALGFVCASAVDPAGNLAITDGLTVRLVAAKTGTFYGQKMTAGHIYTVAGNPGNSRLPPTQAGWTGGPTGDGGPAAKAFLGSAADVTFDRAGNMLIADSGWEQACSACPQVGAMLRVVAARTGTFYGVKMKADYMYSIAGEDVGPGPWGNGGPAARAWLGPGLSSAEVDRFGNIILAGQYQPPGLTVPFDPVTPYVRVIARAAGTFYGQKMKAGHIYQVAGDSTQGPYVNAVPGTRTSLWAASGADADLSGNLVIADGGEVRVLAGRSGRFYGQNMKAADVYRIAGSPYYGDSGDGGRALRAGVWAAQIGLDGFGNVVMDQGAENQVRVIAARTGRFYGQKMTAGDKHGNVVIVDTGNSRVRVVAAATGTFYGVKMNAGDIYTIAGNGTAGFAGNGGPAS